MTTLVADRPWGLALALLVLAVLALALGLVALRRALSRGRGTPPPR